MYYETVFIVNPDISQENNEILTNELVEKIEKAGSRIVKREYWGARPLAYSIQKRKRGHYSLLVTDGAGTISKIIDETLRLDERVLRFLTTSITELSDEPSPLLRRRVAPATDEAKPEDAKSDDAKPAENAEASADKAVESKADEAPKAEAEKAPEEKTTEVKAEVAADAKPAKAESGADASA